MAESWFELGNFSLLRLSSVLHYPSVLASCSCDTALPCQVFNEQDTSLICSFVSEPSGGLPGFRPCVGATVMSNNDPRLQQMVNLLRKIAWEDQGTDLICVIITTLKWTFSVYSLCPKHSVNCFQCISSLGPHNHVMGRGQDHPRFTDDETAFGVIQEPAYSHRPSKQQRAKDWDPHAGLSPPHISQTVAYTYRWDTRGVLVDKHFKCSYLCGYLRTCVDIRKT